ncbi:Arf-GAP with SH3 domain, ANK repeat and PH domain-containing protein 1 [Cichlidogyrus casuarinus]|uniref:Arf-GAP with SH3 domain, ANK repeat and PH domain-containing protein 1 n=1 Tax=Cichlidogyrus casuarinus TaxID=1844966 RepID=A0ABD2Q477_9PLAT
MPEQLSVDQFIRDTLEDIKDPKNSNFMKKVSSVKHTIGLLDGVRSFPLWNYFVDNRQRSSLHGKNKKICQERRYSRKHFFSKFMIVFQAYVESSNSLCDELDRLSQLALEGEETSGNDIGAGLCKFSVVHRDLSNMLKHLLQNLNSVIVYPMETLMSTDVKSDLRKPFEKAVKDYETKYDKLQKEKIQTMKELGAFVPETFTEEMSGDLEKERRKLQLEACEYMIKMTEIKSRKGADLLQQFIDFYHVQINYFKECLNLMEHFGKSMDDLSSRTNAIRKRNDIQRKRLCDTRDEVKKLLLEQEVGLCSLRHVVDRHLTS